MVCGPFHPNPGIHRASGSRLCQVLGCPWPSVLAGGRPILLCIVLLLLLFFLSMARRVCHPHGHPAKGLGVNKADGRGLWWSLHGLASLLSSVSHLCGQGSQGHCGQGQAPRVPLMSLCTDLSPAVLSVGCYLLPPGRNPLFPGTPPVWVALSGLISPPRRPWVFPSADKACLELCKTLWARKGRVPTLRGASPMALTVSKSFHSVTFFPFFNALLSTR